nr:metallophosphoesterase family protein [Pseudenhygromyxa sp. WMMC2535]
MWAQGRWWPVSVCPRLRTLRSLDGWAAIEAAWAATLEQALALSDRHGVGLDLNPANFGFGRRAEGGGARGPIWYLDDEVYSALELSDLAAAVVSRISEYPEVDEARWRSFGQRLRAQLGARLGAYWWRHSASGAPAEGARPGVGEARAWAALIEQVADVPLAPSWEAARAALSAGLRARPRVELRQDEGAQLGAGAALPAKLTAVIADVHANLAALEAVIEAGEAAGVDSWLFLGDAVGYGPQPREVIARLAELPRLEGIRGNHDHMLCFGGDYEANRMARESLRYAREVVGEDERAWLMALPVEREGVLGAAPGVEPGRWLAVHGAPVDPARFRAYVYSLSYRPNLEHLVTLGTNLCFHGHTHVPMAYRLGVEAEAEPEQLELREGGTLSIDGARALLFNPGSVGQPRDGDTRASFALWDRPGRSLSLRRVRYPLAETVAALDDAGLPEDLIARLELGR